MNKDVLVAIPARYASTRFPGKPLALINGIPMIHRVWNRCIQAVPETNVIVATDDDKIERYCKREGMNVVMTSSDHLTGTDRLHEVSKKIQSDIYVNVQGDEPLISPVDICSIIDAHKLDVNTVHYGMARITEASEFFDKNVPKVVIDKKGLLIYTSRSPIPISKSGGFVSALKQVCISAFSRWHLQYYNNKKMPLESVEDLEILRLVENNVPVRMIEISTSIAVDCPIDIKRVEARLSGMGI